MRRVVVGLVALAAACGGSEPHAADAPVTDGPTAIDAYVFVPDESHALGLNDISMLIQLPEDAVNSTTLARMTGIPGFGVDLVPRDVFASLVSAPGDVASSYESFQVVAVRFDLCDRTGVGPCPIGEDGRLRIVFQPVITGSVQVDAVDTALHAFYPIPAAELAPVVNELRALARLRGFQTASPLAINDAIASTSPPSEYRTRLRALIARYAVADRLVRLTLFSQDDRMPPFNWLFRGVEKTGAAFAPIQIASADTTLQQAREVSPPWPPTFAITPGADDPAGIALALDEDAFTAATELAQRDALAALATAQNPTMHTFATEQCVNCHVSAFLFHQRAATVQIDTSTIANVFASSHDLSIGFGISATDAESLRAFGWHGHYPAISQRVVNETAMVLDEIDARYPPAEGVPLPDARIADAAPSVKRVFVASTPHNADLKTAGNGADGADGADRVCAAAAMNAGLGGQWTAWVSTTTVNAIDRITGAGPWYLVDNTTMVFADKASIASGPLVPINVDEHGAVPPGADNVWTGTAPDGTASMDHTCLDWTTSTSDSNIAVGMTGLRTSTIGGWTEYGDTQCSVSLMRLYCFED